jgi:hypothetical protein
MNTAIRTEFELSAHAKDMLQERNIPEEWLWRTLASPDRQGIEPDGNVHYIKSIVEYEGRFLRVVVNPKKVPKRVVTGFFDRRLRRR